MFLDVIFICQMSAFLVVEGDDFAIRFMFCPVVIVNGHILINDRNHYPIFTDTLRFNLADHSLRDLHF